MKHGSVGGGRDQDEFRCPKSGYSIDMRVQDKRPQGTSTRYGLSGMDERRKYLEERLQRNVDGPLASFVKCQ